MNETLTCHVPLTRWVGERATYHLVTVAGKKAERIAIHARLQRLELGKRRGFGSVKVIAGIGTSEWKTSVFPQSQQSEWVLLINRKIMRAEQLNVGDTLAVRLELL